MALKGQIEKKESVTGKIHRLGYNEIQELKAEMQGTIAEAREATADAQEAAGVIFTEFNTITKESDLFSVENGVYYNNVGERTEHSKYTSYHLRAESDFEFFFEGVMELLNQTEISTGSLYATVFSNGVASRENARVTENFSTEGHTTEFPWKMGMAISVKAGELFVISLPDDFYYHNGVEFVKGFSCRTTYGEAGMVMADGVQFGKDQVAEVKRISLQVFSEEEELLLDPPNLFPASFELWNSTGAILDQSVGAALLPSSREPSATYRIPITPGRSYVFTPTPAGGSNDCFFAVGDKNGICLDFVTESIDSYEVKLHYNGAIPAYIYYGVEDINNVGSIIFKDGRIGKLQQDVDKAIEKAEEAKATAEEAKSSAQENREILSNALKEKKEGAALTLSDISPLEHTLKVKLRSKNLFDVSKESKGKWVVLGTGELRDYSIFNTSEYIAIPPNTVFTINYVRHCCFYDANKVFVGDSGATSSTTKRTFTMPANAHYVRFSYQPEKTSGDMVQLELGTDATAYTPFVDVSSASLVVNGESYNPNPDGTVEGVKSRYPTMDLFTNLGGIIIEAEYNRDLNKAYQALVDAIKALGGAV